MWRWRFPHLSSLAALLCACSAREPAPAATSGGALSPVRASLVNVLTQHNSNDRLGANLNETRLTPAALKSGRFGFLYDLVTDRPGDQVNQDTSADPASDHAETYAQPLYLSGVTMSDGRVHDVLIVATEKNHVFAFDADDPGGAILWELTSRDIGAPAPSGQLPAASKSCGDLAPWVGITSTPAVDPTTGMLYVAAKTYDGANFGYVVTKIDVTSGQIRATATVSASYQGATFDARIQLNRPGLLVANRRVYVAFGGHCDAGRYHGWVISYDTDQLTQQAAWADTPEHWFQAGAGGIWQAGAGLAADKDGFVYLMSGNGDSDGQTGFGSAFVRLSADLKVQDWFIPSNVELLNTYDLDLGASGPVILPGGPSGQLVVGGGKEGTIYVLDAANLGQHVEPQVADGKATLPDRVVQRLNDGYQQQLSGDYGDLSSTFLSFNPFAKLTRFGPAPNLHGSPAFWSGANGGSGAIYVWTEEDFLKQFNFDGSEFDPSPRIANQDAILLDPHSGRRVTKIPGMPGGFLSISANGNRDGVLWASHPLQANANAPHARIAGVLIAYDARDVSAGALWHSEKSPRDRVDSYSKFCAPTVANGKVFVPTFSGRIKVYGLR